MPKSDLIPLTRSQLQHLGEIIALHGMISAQLEALNGLLAHLKNLPYRNVVRHGALSEDLDRWVREVRSLYAGDGEVIEIVDKVQGELKRNLIDRNDFVHAVFGARRVDGAFEITGFSGTAWQGAAAMRLGKDQPIRDAEELRSVRDAADGIARLLIQLHQLLARRMPPKE